MKTKTLVTLFLAFAPLSAFADRLTYKDNKGVLYCEIVCTVDKTEHRGGLYPRNNQGDKLKVRGKWVAGGWSITTSGTYQVSPDVHTNASKICENSRHQLQQISLIKGLLEYPEISGVTEKRCKIYPRITTDLGVLTFEMVSESEDDKTDL